MGVSKLTKYFIDHRKAREKVSLRSLAKMTIKKTGKNAKLLCDYYSIIHSLLSEVDIKSGHADQLQSYCEDFSSFANKITNFVKVFQCLGVDLVFFVDAPHGVNEVEFRTKVSTLNDRYVSQLIDVHNFQHLQWSSLVPLQGLMTLKSAGVKIFYCRGEADPELVYYAQNNEEVCGILSGDSDFAVMQESTLFPCGLFDFHSCKEGMCTDIKCEAVTHTRLAKSLKIREEQLPDLAVLCGNDITRPLNRQLMYSLKKELRLESTDIKSVAKWLRGIEVPLIQYKPFKIFCNDHPAYKNAVELTYRYYSKDHSYHSMETSNYESPCDAVLDSIKRSGVWWRDVIPESLTLGSPCMQELLLPLRKVIYFLLGMKSVREFGRTQVKSFAETSVLLPKHDESTSHQCLRSFRDLDANGKLLSSFYLTVNAPMFGNYVKEIGKISKRVARECTALPKCRPNKGVFVCSCLRLIAYLNQHSTPRLNLSQAELDALLLTCLSCCSDLEFPHCITSISPSKRSITVSAWFLCVLSHTYLLAALLGHGDNLPQPKDLFSPMIFVCFYDTLTEESKSAGNKESVVMQTIVQKFRSVPLVNSLSSEMFPQRVRGRLPGFEADFKILNLFIVTLKMVDCNQDLITRSEPQLQQKLYPQKQPVVHVTHPLRPSAMSRNVLPVKEHKDHILKLVAKHQVVCIEGGTGSGKSSMIPQFILEQAAFHSKRCKILVSQPNHITAIRLAQRVSREQREDVGKTVGYGVDSELYEVSLSDTKIIYCTREYMLQSLLCQQKTVEYTHIIVDEIHERSADADFTLFLVRKFISIFENVKVILMSATMQSNLLIKYFQEALGPHKVAGPYFVGKSRFPIDIYCIDELHNLCMEDTKFWHKEQQCKAALNLTTKLSELAPISKPVVSPFTKQVCTELIIFQAELGKCILVFLPGFGDICDYYKELTFQLHSRSLEKFFSVFVFHSQLGWEEQTEAFKSPPSNRVHVILSTSMAESSLTFPELKMVINFGLSRVPVYQTDRHVSQYITKWCSHVSCTQRAGRVGRVSKGVAVHLFTRKSYECLPAFDPPEIITSPLAKNVLKAMDIAEHLHFPSPSGLLGMLIEPPSMLQMEAALTDLVEIGALNDASENADVTLLGKFSLALPLDLKLCRMVLLGIFFGCPLDAIVMAAALSMYRDTFTSPTQMIIHDLGEFRTQLERSMKSRAEFDAGLYSDPIMYCNLFIKWLEFRHNEVTISHCDRAKLARRFAKKYSVQAQRLLDFENSVCNIASCVLRSKFVPHDIHLYTELRALAEVDTTVKRKPQYVVPGVKNKLEAIPKTLFFCSDYNILKVLIIATSPANILYGERQLESSDASERKRATATLQAIRDLHLDLASTVAMELTGRSYTNNDADSNSERCSTKTECLTEETLQSLMMKIVPVTSSTCDAKIVKRIALVQFSSVIHREFDDQCANRSLIEISPLCEEVKLFWQFTERRNMLQVEGKLPPPFHPCALTWCRLTAMEERVDIENWRNPAAFVCKLQQPTKPFFAVASDLLGTRNPSCMSATSITILPQIPSVLLMMLSFQPFSANMELVFDNKQCRLSAAKLNSREISGIDNDFSKEDVIRLNRLRNAVSNALKSNEGILTMTSRKIPHLLQDVLKRRAIGNRTDSARFLPTCSDTSARLGCKESDPTLVRITVNPSHDSPHRIAGQYYPAMFYHRVGDGRNVETRKQNCEFCKRKGFKSQRSYQTHLKSHIKCDICEFEACPKVLRKHKLMHVEILEPDTADSCRESYPLPYEPLAVTSTSNSKLQLQETLSTHEDTTGKGISLHTSFTCFGTSACTNSARLGCKESDPTVVRITVNPSHDATHRIAGQYYPALHCSLVDNCTPCLDSNEEGFESVSSDVHYTKQKYVLKEWPASVKETSRPTMLWEPSKSIGFKLNQCYRSQQANVDHERHGILSQYPNDEWGTQFEQPDEYREEEETYKWEEYNWINYRPYTELMCNFTCKACTRYFKFEKDWHYQDLLFYHRKKSHPKHIIVERHTTKNWHLNQLICEACGCKRRSKSCRLHLKSYQKCKMGSSEYKVVVTKHQQFHHRVDSGRNMETRKHSCGFCFRKGFKSQRSYQAHVKSHIKCDICEFEACPKVLTEHKLMHIEILKPDTADSCRESYPLPYEPLAVTGVSNSKFQLQETLSTHEDATGKGTSLYTSLTCFGASACANSEGVLTAVMTDVATHDRENSQSYNTEADSTTSLSLQNDNNKSLEKKQPCKHDPGSEMHMVEYFKDYIRKNGGEAGMTILRSVAFQSYRKKYGGHLILSRCLFLSHPQDFEVIDGAKFCRIKLAKTIISGETYKIFPEGALTPINGPPITSDNHSDSVASAQVSASPHEDSETANHTPCTCTKNINASELEFQNPSSGWILTPTTLSEVQESVPSLESSTSKVDQCEVNEEDPAIIAFQKQLAPDKQLKLQYLELQKPVPPATLVTNSLANPGFGSLPAADGNDGDEKITNTKQGREFNLQSSFRSVATGCTTSTQLSFLNLLKSMGQETSSAHNDIFDGFLESSHEGVLCSLDPSQLQASPEENMSNPILPLSEDIPSQSPQSKSSLFKADAVASNLPRSRNVMPNFECGLHKADGASQSRNSALGTDDTLQSESGELEADTGRTSQLTMSQNKPVDAPFPPLSKSTSCRNDEASKSKSVLLKPKVDDTPKSKNMYTHDSTPDYQNSSQQVYQSVHDHRATPGSDMHLVMYLKDFIKNNHGEASITSLRRIPFQSYQEKYGGPLYLSKDLFKSYPQDFEVIEGTGFCRVRLLQVAQTIHEREDCGLPQCSNPPDIPNNPVASIPHSGDANSDIIDYAMSIRDVSAQLEKGKCQDASTAWVTTPATVSKMDESGPSHEDSTSDVTSEMMATKRPSVEVHEEDSTTVTVVKPVVLAKQLQLQSSENEASTNHTHHQQHATQQSVATAESSCKSSGVTESRIHTNIKAKGTSNVHFVSGVKFVDGNENTQKDVSVDTKGSVPPQQFGQSGNTIQFASVPCRPPEPGSKLHLVEFLKEFLEQNGGEARLGVLRKCAFNSYQQKYFQCLQYSYLGKKFLRSYPQYFDISDGTNSCTVKLHKPIPPTSDATTLELHDKPMPGSLPATADKKREQETTCSEQDHIVDEDELCFSSIAADCAGPTESPCFSQLKSMVQETHTAHVVNPDGSMSSTPQETVHLDTSLESQALGSTEHIVKYFKEYLSTHGGRDGCHVDELMEVFDLKYTQEYTLPRQPPTAKVNKEFFRNHSDVFRVSRHDIVSLREITFKTVSGQTEYAMSQLPLSKSDFLWTDIASKPLNPESGLPNRGLPKNDFLWPIKSKGVPKSALPKVEDVTLPLKSETNLPMRSISKALWPPKSKNSLPMSASPEITNGTGQLLKVGDEAPKSRSSPNTDGVSQQPKTKSVSLMVDQVPNSNRGILKVDDTPQPHTRKTKSDSPQLKNTSQPQQSKIACNLQHSTSSQATPSSFNFEPFTPQHVAEYFSNHLSRYGECSVEELKKTFERKYKKQYIMSYYAGITLVSEKFFRRRSDLFEVTRTGTVKLKRSARS